MTSEGQMTSMLESPRILHCDFEVQHIQSPCVWWVSSFCWRFSDIQDNSTSCSGDGSEGGLLSWICLQKFEHIQCRRRVSPQCGFWDDLVAARGERRTCHSLDICKEGCGFWCASWGQSCCCTFYYNTCRLSPSGSGLSNEAAGAWQNLIGWRRISYIRDNGKVSVPWYWSTRPCSRWRRRCCGTWSCRSRWRWRCWPGGRARRRAQSWSLARGLWQTRRMEAWSGSAGGWTEPRVVGLAAGVGREDGGSVLSWSGWEEGGGRETEQQMTHWRYEMVMVPFSRRMKRRNVTEVRVCRKLVAGWPRAGQFWEISPEPELWWVWSEPRPRVELAGGRRCSRMVRRCSFQEIIKLQQHWLMWMLMMVIEVHFLGLLRCSFWRWTSSSAWRCWRGWRSCPAPSPPGTRAPSAPDILEITRRSWRRRRCCQARL